MAFVGVGLFFLVFFAAMIAGIVFWIMKIVEVSQIPEPQYRAAGTDKTVWVLVVVLVGWVGGLIWQFAKRDDVLRARLLPPPGWPGGPAPWGAGPGGAGPGWAGPGPGWVGAPAALPSTAAGWYPEPGTGWSAYWDGYRWTGARRPPSIGPQAGPQAPALQPPRSPTAPLPGSAPGPDLQKRPD